MRRLAAETARRRDFAHELQKWLRQAVGHYGTELQVAHDTSLPPIELVRYIHANPLRTRYLVAKKQIAGIGPAHFTRVRPSARSSQKRRSSLGRVEMRRGGVG